MTSAQFAHRMVEEQARRVPRAVAVAVGEQMVSYAELNARANQLARALVESGVGAEDRVAVLMPPSVDLVVVLLGVLKAGGAYVPLDVRHPDERIKLIMADAAVRLTVTAAALATRIKPRAVCFDQWDCAGYPAGDLPDRVRSENSAYVIYTSGSTGRPKGVIVSHRSLGAYLSRTRHGYPGLDGESLLHSSIAFDLTVTSLYGPLVSGGCVRIGELAGGGPRPTFTKMTPSHLELLDSLPDEASPSKCLVLGGEALSAQMVARWRARHPDVLVCNSYGPTETTVNVTEYRLPPGSAEPKGAVPIGRPFPGVRAYVLDSGLRPVPPGIPGELYIAGSALARGYLNRPGM